MMRCHPLFHGFAAPRAPILGAYRFEVLGPEAVEEDFVAVVESTERLAGFMGGDWPNGLTLEENRVDLCWHLKEFEMNRSFAWIARDEAGGYIGCVYIFPRFAANVADVPVWVRSGAGPDAVEATLKAVLHDWLHGPDWPDLDYRIVTPSDRRG